MLKETLGGEGANGEAMIQHGDIRIMSATSTYGLLQGMTVPLTVCLARKLDVEGCVASRST